MDGMMLSLKEAAHTCNLDYFVEVCVYPTNKVVFSSEIFFTKTHDYYHYMYLTFQHFFSTVNWPSYCFYLSQAENCILRSVGLWHSSCRRPCRDFIMRASGQ